MKSLPVEYRNEMQFDELKRIWKFIRQAHRARDHIKKTLKTTKKNKLWLPQIHWEQVEDHMKCAESVLT